MKPSIPGQARILHCTFILYESRRDGWFTYCASVSVCVHRTRHIAYHCCFWQDSVRSVLPSVVVPTTRRNGLCVNERFVSGPRRKRANNLVSLSSLLLFVKSFNTKNGIRNNTIITYGISYHDRAVYSCSSSVVVVFLGSIENELIQSLFNEIINTIVLDDLSKNCHGTIPD
jgi:hypothetical protein